MSIEKNAARWAGNIVKKETEKKEDGRKISSDFLQIARQFDDALGKLDHDLEVLKNRSHESKLDAEFDEFKRDLREDMSRFLSR